MSDITNDRMFKALSYLATTDEEAALAKVEVMRCEHRCKLVRAQEFINAAGVGSVEARKCVAEVAPATREADDMMLKAMGAYEYLKAKRSTEERVIEAWRSLNSNRRQGMI